MKKYWIAMLAAALMGCSEELTQSPSNQLPSNEAIQSITDLSNAVNGAYVVMVEQGSYAGDFGLYADGKAGELVDLLAGNQFSPVIKLQTDRNSTFSIKSYSDIYVGLARVNDILTVCDGVSAISDAEKTKKADLIGQLHALRALFHFDAARLFAQIPTAADNINAPNSGIIISKAKYPVSAKFKRSTLKESYDFIVAELLEAQKTLSKSRAYGKFDYYAATALLARTYQYMGDWTNALKCAEEVIACNAYKLYTPANYTKVWSKTQTDESILEIITTDLVSAQRNSLGYYTTPSGYAEASMTDEFVAFMTPRTDDIRSQMIKKYGDSKGNYTAYWPMKYPGQDGATAPQYVNNPKLIRLSEMYLIAAEAILKGAPVTSNSAAYYINKLRQNRIANYTDVATVNMDDVLTECRLEFFAENHRSFDLVRNKLDIPSNPYVLGTIKYNDHRLLTAIPQRETDISPELTEYPEN